MDNKDSKHVYIFGNKSIGFLGFTYDKEEYKRISENRKQLDSVKVKNSKFYKENLSINNEFVEVAKDTFMTADEENYFLESFSQFQLDVVRDIDTLCENIKYFNLSSKEKYIVSYLLKYLLDYKQFILHDKYEEDYDEYDYFDIDVAAKYFVEHVLES